MRVAKVYLRSERGGEICGFKGLVGGFEEVLISDR
jgi:hypothetical protein